MNFSACSFVGAATAARAITPGLPSLVTHNRTGQGIALASRRQRKPLIEEPHEARRRSLLYSPTWHFADISLHLAASFRKATNASLVCDSVGIWISSQVLNAFVSCECLRRAISSAQLRGAEDRIRKLEAELRHQEDRADQAEKWLYQILIAVPFSHLLHTGGFAR